MKQLLAPDGTPLKKKRVKLNSCVGCYFLYTLNSCLTKNADGNYKYCCDSIPFNRKYHYIFVPK
jgi:hypothetical protein